MPQILLVEDSVEYQIVVRRALHDSHQVSVAFSVREAMGLVETTEFDLLLVDICLPEGDGFDLCAKWRNMSPRHRPVIFLSARAELGDKLMAFSLGADDYLVKPFEPLELRARVEARLRRDQSGSLALGKVFLEPARFRAALREGSDERELGLTPTEFRLLYHLGRNASRVFSREQLLDAVWGTSANVTDRTVDTHIYTLRRKLGEQASIVQSVPGVGYRVEAAH